MSFDPAQLDRATIEAIKAHAVACFPQEMCGAITPRGWEPLQNRHREPNQHFDCAEQCAQLQVADELLALVHSHPDNQRPERQALAAPSGDDIAGQRIMGIPWGITLCNEIEAAEPYFWGDSLARPPLEERQFRHGPSGSDGRGDCYALIRDWYLLERGILLPDFARDDGWWTRPGVEMYEQLFPEAGFRAVPLEEAEHGDVVLFQIRSQAANHGGIYLGGGLIFHHLTDRLSRVEGASQWLRLVRRVLRYEGSSSATNEGSGSAR